MTGHDGAAHRQISVAKSDEAVFNPWLYLCCNWFHGQPTWMVTVCYSFVMSSVSSYAFVCLLRLLGYRVDDLIGWSVWIEWVVVWCVCSSSGCCCCCCLKWDVRPCCVCVSTFLVFLSTVFVFVSWLDSYRVLNLLVVPVRYIDNFAAIIKRCICDVHHLHTCVFPVSLYAIIVVIRLTWLGLGLCFIGWFNSVQFSSVEFVLAWFGVY